LGQWPHSQHTRGKAVISLYSLFSGEKRAAKRGRTTIGVSALLLLNGPDKRSLTNHWNLSNFSSVSAETGSYSATSE